MVTPGQGHAGGSPSLAEAAPQKDTGGGAAVSFHVHFVPAAGVPLERCAWPAATLHFNPRTRQVLLSNPSIYHPVFVNDVRLLTNGEVTVRDGSVIKMVACPQSSATGDHRRTATVTRVSSHSPEDPHRPREDSLASWRVDVGTAAAPLWPAAVKPPERRVSFADASADVDALDDGRSSLSPPAASSEDRETGPLPAGQPLPRRSTTRRPSGSVLSLGEWGVPMRQAPFTPTDGAPHCPPLQVDYLRTAFPRSDGGSSICFSVRMPTPTPTSGVATDMPSTATGVHTASGVAELASFLISPSALYASGSRVEEGRLVSRRTVLQTARRRAHCSPASVVHARRERRRFAPLVSATILSHGAASAMQRVRPSSGTTRLNGMDGRAAAQCLLDILGSHIDSRRAVVRPFSPAETTSLFSLFRATAAEASRTLSFRPGAVGCHSNQCEAPLVRLSPPQFCCGALNGSLLTLWSVVVQRLCPLGQLPLLSVPLLFLGGYTDTSTTRGARAHNAETLMALFALYVAAPAGVCLLRGPTESPSDAALATAPLRASCTRFLGQSDGDAFCDEVLHLFSLLPTAALIDDSVYASPTRTPPVGAVVTPSVSSHCHGSVLTDGAPHGPFSLGGVAARGQSRPSALWQDMTGAYSPRANAVRRACPSPREGRCAPCDAATYRNECPRHSTGDSGVSLGGESASEVGSTSVSAACITSFLQENHLKLFLSGSGGGDAGARVSEGGRVLSITSYASSAAGARRRYGAGCLVLPNGRVRLLCWQCPGRAPWARRRRQTASTHRSAFSSVCVTEQRMAEPQQQRQCEPDAGVRYVMDVPLPQDRGRNIFFEENPADLLTPSAELLSGPSCLWCSRTASTPDTESIFEYG